MVRTKDEIISMLSAKIGEDNSDETLSLFEDITDTFDDYQSKTQDATNWKQKYEDNDNEWRAKYKERFMSGGSEKDDEFKEEDEDQKEYTFESLFQKG